MKTFHASDYFHVSDSQNLTRKQEGIGLAASFARRGDIISALCHCEIVIQHCSFDDRVFGKAHTAGWSSGAPERGTADA
jgi:hypothetical protein